MQQQLLYRSGRANYLDVDALQRKIHSEIVAGVHEDTVIYSEFAPVYTAGSRTKDEDIPDPTVPVVRVDRGGSVTYHGPGQLVAYPIMRIHGRQDVVAYVRALEAAVIDTIAEFGVQGQRVDGRTGVWLLKPGLPDRKICAIGVRFSKHVTMHGLALNVAPELNDFSRIIPCGLQDASVTSLADLGITTTLDAVRAALHPKLEHHLAQFSAPSEVLA